MNEIAGYKIKTMKPIIYIMGVAGSGKTTIGKLLSQKTGISFLQRTHLPNSGVPTLVNANSNAATFAVACCSEAFVLLILFKASFLSSLSIAQSGATGFGSFLYISTL